MGCYEKFTLQFLGSCQKCLCHTGGGLLLLQDFVQVVVLAMYLSFVWGFTHIPKPLPMLIHACTVYILAAAGMAV